MSGEVLIEGLSKAYQLGQIGTGTLTNDLRVLWARMRGKPNPMLKIGQEDHHNQEGETIWALKDVNLKVEQGEVLGIIGRNGAGKSTLLKILSRVTAPTTGLVKVKGRIASLLEVGTGFHPDLTGRENIFLNGAILGMKRTEINRRFDEIVEFSGVEQFIDTPVKRYSSGMYVRLAFAVAAHLEPEILLVDEVLAVGDMAFQSKCLGKMGDVARGGRTVLFVSHNMGAISRLCSRSVLLDLGEIREDGDTEKVISSYLTSGVQLDGEFSWEQGIANPGVKEFRIRSVRIKNNSGEVSGMLDVRKPFTIEIEYEITERLPHCRIGIAITTVDGIIVLASYDSDNDSSAKPRMPGSGVSICRIPKHLLAPNRYLLSINAGIKGMKNLANRENIISFEIVDTGAVGSHFGGDRMGIIRPELVWEKEIISSEI